MKDYQISFKRKRTIKIQIGRRPRKFKMEDNNNNKIKIEDNQKKSK